MKPKKIIQDHVLMENFCNMNCVYCKNICYYPKIKNDKIFSEIKNLNIKSLMKNTQNILKKSRKIFDIYALKLSGGEIFLFKSFILKLLKEESKNYPLIQVLTNNTLLEEKTINKLSEIKNLILQVSLDGHSLKLNKLRNENKKNQEKILKNLKSADKLNIPIEINSVLTSTNTARFYEFLDFLIEKGIKASVIPFPVRNVDNCFPSEKDIKQFKKNVLNRYKNYSEILPTKKYIKTLCQFMKKKYRRNKCFVPNIILSSFEGGEVSYCPCEYIKNYKGNILTSFKKLEKSMKNEKITKKISFYPPCNRCFTHYDLINLYLSNKISKNEFMQIPLFSKKESFDYLY